VELRKSIKLQFVEVGNALLSIRDNRLYRITHRTFEAYCKGKWGMKKSHAYRLIDAASVAVNLSPMGDNPKPTSERQVRLLTKLEPEQQKTAWENTN
jgi:hypothetical protein